MTDIDHSRAQDTYSPVWPEPSRPASLFERMSAPRSQWHGGTEVAFAHLSLFDRMSSPRILPPAVKQPIVEEGPLLPCGFVEGVSLIDDKIITPLMLDMKLHDFPIAIKDERLDVVDRVKKAPVAAIGADVPVFAMLFDSPGKVRLLLRFRCGRVRAAWVRLALVPFSSDAGVKFEEVGPGKISIEIDRVVPSAIALRVVHVTTRVPLLWKLRLLVGKRSFSRAPS